MHYLLHTFQRMLALALALGLLAGCAKDIPRYVPPELRTVAPQDKAWPHNHYLALAYHAVQDDMADQTFLAVRTDQLIEQLHWLRENGYQAVSVEQILAAHHGGPALPAKAVLLSFDDGYKDFQTRVLPVLKAFDWPAVLAPVGIWLTTPTNESVAFGDISTPRSTFLNPQELAQVAQSGLVEIGAHSYRHHQGIQGNPQGNQLPGMANRQYLQEQQRYETSEEFEQRLRADVQAITSTLRSLSGRSPRVWIWPYGAMSGTAQRIIREAGYELFLTLENGLAKAADTESVPRMLMSGNNSIRTVAQLIATIQDTQTLRVAHVDLDYVYDPDPEQQNRNLDALVQRIYDLQANTVFLQAFSDPQGDGLVREVYFPNRVLPMRADLFNRVSWQITSRTGAKVYAWMPVLSLDLDATHPRVQRWDPSTGNTSVDPAQYQRLSPFNARNRQAIGQLYEDLASYASFHGVLYHDDALLSDFEDASPDALRAYAAAGLSGDMTRWRDDPTLMHAWTRLKSRALIDFTHELTAKVRAIRGVNIKTARNIFAAPVLQPESEAWFAQNLDDFLAAYDWTAPMAIPLMEGISYAQAPRWLERLVETVGQRPGALDRTVFELQTKDWRGTANGAAAQAIDSQTIAIWMRQLQRSGARSLGYYPDDFAQNHPSLEVVRPFISNAWFPAP